MNCNIQVSSTNIINPESKINNSCRNGNKFIDISLPKFIQRFIHKNVFKKDTCNWIINESEKYASKNGGWKTNRHSLYPTTDLEIQNIKTIFPFILTCFYETITKNIIKYYNFKINDIIIEINDLFIVKYESCKQNNLEFHKDTSCISVNILLNDISEFEGGGTIFDDGITVFLNQGDAIIHSGKSSHSGLQITTGKRYLLIFFIDIYESSIIDN